MTTSPSAVTYASGVSRKSVRLALPLTTLNGLEVKVGDVLERVHHSTFLRKDLDFLRS